MLNHSFSSIMNYQATCLALAVGTWNTVLCKALHASWREEKQTSKYWKKRHRVQWEQVNRRS